MLVNLIGGLRYEWVLDIDGIDCECCCLGEGW